MRLKLLVLRSADPTRVAQFYYNLGLVFDYHQHNKGPMHYASEIGNTVIEIYPLAKGQNAADPHLRLGLEVANFEQVMEKLMQQGVKILHAPQQTEFGWMSVIEDPDGRKIEVYKA